MKSLLFAAALLGGLSCVAVQAEPVVSPPSEGFIVVNRTDHSVIIKDAGQYRTANNGVVVPSEHQIKIDHTVEVPVDTYVLVKAGPHGNQTPVCFIESHPDGDGYFSTSGINYENSEYCEVNLSLKPNVVTLKTGQPTLSKPSLHVVNHSDSAVKLVLEGADTMKFTGWRDYLGAQRTISSQSNDTVWMEVLNKYFPQYGSASFGIYHIDNAYYGDTVRICDVKLVHVENDRYRLETLSPFGHYKEYPYVCTWSVEPGTDQYTVHVKDGVRYQKLGSNVAESTSPKTSAKAIPRYAHVKRD